VGGLRNISSVRRGAPPVALLVLITALDFPVDLLDETGLGGDPRRPGLHLGAVITDMASNMFRKRAQWVTLTAKERERASYYFELGFMWERVFEEVWRERLELRLRRKLQLEYQCGWLRAGGMWMTPDGIDPAEWALWEFKLTWKTVRRLEDLENDDAFWPWLVQIKCYLRALKMRRCYLCAFFVNGDYREPRVPDCRLLQLDFEKHELDRNWAMVLNHKDLMHERGLL